ncbi:COIL [Anthophora retusa]
MNRSNFRVKINLDKFYNDVRRCSWVFIDGTKILQINHMKEHIMKLFNIKEPFHLLLNETEYLPPNEDIRILKENETILVTPGSGLDIGLEVRGSVLNLPEEENFIKSERSRSDVQHKQLQTNLSSVLPNPISEIMSNENASLFENDIPEITMSSEKTEIDTTLTDDFNIMENIMACPKRKRVRHRNRKRKNTQQQEIKEEENKSRKPKIIDTCIIASGKHIRFDSVDNEDIPKKEVNHLETVNGSSMSKLSPTRELANLLSLGQTPTPLTFTNTRVKEEVKLELMSDEETHFVASSENTNESIGLNKRSEEEKDLLSKDYELLPILTETPTVGDIIAFKVFKEVSEYTEELSNFIVAQVNSYNLSTNLYTLIVLQGLSELQEPVGEFEITQEETEGVVNDIITLDYAQIMTPRLVSGCNSTPVTSTSCIN